MNINTIKKAIKGNLGEAFRFRYNGTRKQTEVFEGTIEGVYDSIFVIRLDGDDKIKTFSYADVLMDCLEILNKK